jgi:hypothetical protein
MKKIVSYLIAAVSLLPILMMSVTAAAASPNVQPPAPPTSSTKPSVVVTAFGGSDLLDFAELYNQTSDPINLTGVQLQFTVHDMKSGGCGDQTYSTIAPDGWLLPKSYFTFERGSGDDPAEAYYMVPPDLLDGCSEPRLSGIDLTDSAGLVSQKVDFVPGVLTTDNWAQHKQRAKSSINVTGVFASDYVLQSSTANLYSTPLYQPPANTNGLQIVEIFPHSYNCSPTDTSLLCNDYVKLFNDSKEPVNLAEYRLRTSYGGDSSSSSNTVNLNGNLQPGHYKLVNSKDDDSQLGLTQTGGYIWLEDAEGAKIYQPIIAYPDASADSKVGYGWAFDGSDWQWTSTPEPTSQNIFTLQALTKSTKKTSFRKPCASDQYRNPVTNRCRKIKPAKAKTYCKSGQQRNPDTGRCRSILRAKTKKPCKPGQERNPDTGRCRKVQPKISNVKDIKTISKTNSSHWYMIAFIAVGAAAYIIYEWRQEFSSNLDRLKLKFQQIFHLSGRQKAQNLLK